MTQRERQAWIIVAVLWVTLFLVLGADNGTEPVFFTPLLNEFHWSRARVSTFAATVALLSGLIAPLTGWLLDRIEARIVIVAGAVSCAAGFLMASQVHSYTPLLVAYVLVGLGAGASGLVACIVVVANWFGPENRGAAMGLAQSGHGLGASGMIIFASFVISHGGWRLGYTALAIPMIVIVIPLVLLFVKSRPEKIGNRSLIAVADTLAGFEVGEALRTRSFWLIMLATMLFGFTVASIALHLVPYLIGVGYKPTVAAEFLSIVWIGSATGRYLMGLLADRIGARAALVINFSVQAVMVLTLYRAQNPMFLLSFAVIWGLGSGAPGILLPLVTAHSLGLKRFGSINGLVMMVMTFGTASGPVASGRIYDVTGSYSLMFQLMILMYIVSIIATIACRPLEVEQRHLAPAAAAV